MTDTPSHRQPATPDLRDGQGDRLALLRLYDELDDAGKQELLRFAVKLGRAEHVGDRGPSATRTEATSLG